METITQNLLQRTVGDVVADDYRRGSVFKQFGIDFCCGGGITVEAACRKNGVDPEALLESLRAADARGLPNRDLDARTWDLTFLADYIVQVHHRYVRETLPVLLAFTEKVARVHGARHPKTVEIAAHVRDLAAEMTAHMASEEERLFPLVRRIRDAQGEQGARTSEPLMALRDLVEKMEKEHDAAGEIVRRLRTLTEDYTPPPGACNTHRASYAKLAEFEEDLHRHVHLENNILFPRTIAMEAVPVAGSA
jgi:regulator of cell morphogenesis and NO signaling